MAIFVPLKTDVFIPQQPGFHVGYSEKDTHELTMGIKYEILEVHVMFRGVVGQDIMFMGDSAKRNRAHTADTFLKEENIPRIDL